MTQDRIFMIKREWDIILVIILIFLKFTILPEMSWWIVLAPGIVTFVHGFIIGFNEGFKDKYKK